MQEASQWHDGDELGVFFGRFILGQAHPLVCLEKGEKKERYYFSPCFATRYKALCGVFSGLGGTERLRAWTGGRGG